MDQTIIYEIRVEGRLSDFWSAWFGGLDIKGGPGRETLLRGKLSDQAALFGILNKIQALNLTLISVKRK